MDPHKFLEFAEALCTTTICDDETDSRVGIDRCYYAAAHETFKSIHQFVDSEDSSEAAKDISLMAPQLHAMLRRVLKKINSSIQKNMLWLFQNRKEATYYLTRKPAILSDAVKVAKEAFDNQETLKEELRNAYGSNKIDGYYWLTLKQSLRRWES